MSTGSVHPIAMDVFRFGSPIKATVNALSRAVGPKELIGQQTRRGSAVKSIEKALIVSPKNAGIIHEPQCRLMESISATLGSV